ncbi:hypothetical protein CVT26_005102 [Gymnopilus dilepis]|uniref:Uncharacterized protein n=1 Tax=Gymnopilus dilepis TaxID=231916 RepID=A0A409Y088_9AGAR|nr:hypothetical protein CVT26_005102 [Gymnopilus dilepis]
MSEEIEIVDPPTEVHKVASPDIIHLRTGVPSVLQRISGTTWFYKIWFSESTHLPEPNCGFAGDLYIIKNLSCIYVFWKRRKDNGKEVWSLTNSAKKIYHPDDSKFVLNAGVYPEWRNKRSKITWSGDFQQAGERFLSGFGLGSSKGRPIVL